MTKVRAGRKCLLPALLAGWGQRREAEDREAAVHCGLPQSELKQLTHNMCWLAKKEQAGCPPQHVM